MGQQLTILIVDDDDVDRMAVRRALTAAGLEATLEEAQDCATAVTALTQRAFDCALLDYMLPDGDGLSVLRTVREADVCTPIIVLTGQRDERLVVELLQAGASDYLSKEKMSPENLLHSVRNAIRIAEAESERRAAEGNLAKTGARLRYLIDNTPAIIYSAVPTGDFRLTSVSENIVRVLGYSPAEFLQEPDFWFEHIHPDDRRELFSRLPHLVKEGQQVHEYRFRHKDGPYLWMHDTLRLVRDVNGEPMEIIGSLADITERKHIEDRLRKSNEELLEANRRLEEAHTQLLQSEKLAAIGQLAAGVAHEINNPVGYVGSNLGTLAGYVDDLIEMVNLYEIYEPLLQDHPKMVELIESIKQKVDLDYLRQDARDLIEESKQGVARVKQIVQDLKDFSHVDEAEWQWADLHKGLDSTLNIVHNELKYKAKVIKEYGELPQVECLAFQLNQVFMNMLVNAVHAIEERGIITIRTKFADNDWVWVEVADTGKGIPAEDLNRIFDPFFTTKPVGKGTGLGLSLSYGIVNKHDGRIEVESEPGKGTCFRVWLPVRQAEQRADNCDQRSVVSGHA